MNPNIILYGMTGSGNCWKPKALLDLLGRPYDWQEVNSAKGESRSFEFMSKNPNGKVPLLEETSALGSRYLAESNAMLCYLAEGTDWLPSEPWQRAKTLEWMFFEQYSHEPYIATVRFWVAYLGKQGKWKEKIDEAMKKGDGALGVMDFQLGKTPFLVGATPTIADIALYAYTHVADEGGYSLERYPALRAWLARLEAVKGFVPMRGSYTLPQSF